MGYSSHRGTAGHTIATSIIGKDGGSGGGSDKLPGIGGFHHINIKQADNGITVTHQPALPKGTKEYSEKAPEEQLHVFRDATEAHHHIGTLLGVRMGSGQQEV